jgi:hypothetical protein
MKGKVDDEWKGFGRKRSWLNFRSYPSIWSGGTEENHKNLGQDSQSRGRNLNPDLSNTMQEC